MRVAAALFLFTWGSLIAGQVTRAEPGLPEREGAPLQPLAEPVRAESSAAISREVVCLRLDHQPRADSGARSPARQVVVASRELVVRVRDADVVAAQPVSAARPTRSDEVTTHAPTVVVRRGEPPVWRSLTWTVRRIDPGEAVAPASVEVMVVVRFPDLDQDGIGDADEVRLGSDPHVRDSDGDGMDDGFEVDHGLNPLDGADANEDADADGLSNLDEFRHRSDPRRADTDGDGMPDAFEVGAGLDPSAEQDAELDLDSDGLNNRSEFERGTRVDHADTDGDLLLDGFEVHGGLDPKATTDPSADPDADGLSHLEEQIYGTRPDRADSDGDGRSDGEEVAAGSSPTDGTDEGRTPPAGALVELELTVGDNSGSRSERYHLIVGPFVHQATQYGVVESRRYKFRSGERYPIRIVHMGSKLEVPDFDYVALIKGDATRFRIEDPQGILGNHGESGAFYAAGKLAFLVTEAGVERTDSELSPGMIDPWEIPAEWGR